MVATMGVQGVSMAPPPLVLTGRQRDMVELVAQELSNEEIARRLGISPQTVKNHMTMLMARLGCQTRVGVIVWAFRHGLLTVDHPC